jgi:hypothetical protein
MTTSFIIFPEGAVESVFCATTLTETNNAEKAIAGTLHFRKNAPEHNIELISICL